MKKILLFLTAAVLFLNGCAAKVYNIQQDIDIFTLIENVKKSTPSLCSYRGRTVITLETDRKISFSSLINKKCNSDTLITILGAFNNPAAEIKYWNKKVTIKTPSNENTEALQRIADESLFHVISFFKSPYYLPRSDEYKLAYTKDSYVFINENGDKIFADENFKLYKYIQGDIIVEYKWDNDFLSAMEIESNEMKLKIKFYTKDGWRGENNNGQ